MNSYWDDYDRVDEEFEHYWTSRAKEAPLVDTVVDLVYIDRIRNLARQFFHAGYEQHKQELGRF